ncbi:MAG TPA: tripartite tricarboxylate transporter substrate binding protein [Bordetella sp.]
MYALKSFIAATVAAVCALIAPASASAADTFPDHPIRIVVPFSPSGGIDILARTIAQELTGQWQSGVVVENKPGASGNIGTDYAARSAPDGYTWLMTANTLVMTPSLMPVNFKPKQDFTPVTEVAIGYLALVTRPGLPVKSVHDLIALAKSEPGKLNYGSPGTGTPHHLAMELLKQKAGFNVVHVPYKGSAELVNGVLSGQVSLAFLPVHQALALARAGKLQMLAAGGAKRTAVTPDVPSLAEASGIKDIDVDMWYALYLPAGAPAELVKKINVAVNNILKEPSVAKRLADVGLAPRGSTPQELAATTGSDLSRWAQVIQLAGLKAGQ